MIVLTTGSGSKTITVIPRFEPTGTIRYTLRNEEQNKVVKQASKGSGGYTYSNGYLSFSAGFDNHLIEGVFYTLTIEEQSGSNFNLLHRSKVFVTDQTVLPKYTTQNGEFTEYADNNNEFVII